MKRKNKVKNNGSTTINKYDKICSAEDGLTYRDTVFLIYVKFNFDVNVLNE